MCGIGGILRVTQPGDSLEPIPGEWLDQIDARIAWRGPDGYGRFRDRAKRADDTTIEIALVHRRLSIIDHEGGHQPMVWTPERGVWPIPQTPGHELDLRDEPCQGLVAVAFNGCIYNHRELRAELESLGHRFGTDHSDTEVLIHGWREWGEDLFKHLEGMYAFALWERDEQSFTYGRDRFGEKPMYVTYAGVFGSTRAPDVIFASSVGATRCETDWPCRVDLPVASWLHRGFSGEIPLRLVFPLAEGKVSVESHEQLPTRAVFNQKRTLGRPEAPLSHLVRASVTQRLDADVPIAAFLSGGIDSSVVTMCASDALDGELTSICVRMPSTAYDESAFAERVAEHLGVRNHITVDAGDADLDVAGDFVRLIETLGLPFGDSSILPTYWACRAARPHAKVVLSGDGGDELFLGYERYRAIWMLNWLKLVPLKRQKERFLNRSDPKSKSDKLARLLDAASGLGYPDLVAIFPGVDLKRLVRQKSFTLGGLGAEGSLFGSVRDARDWDIANYLPGDLLRKVDTASMLAGVEVRCPLLDSRVADAALAMPIGAHRRGRRGKRVLREMLYERLPAEMVDRPKSGFTVPVGEWFRTDFGGMRRLMMDLFGGAAMQTRPGTDATPFGVVHDVLDIDLGSVEQMIDEHDVAGGLAPASGTTGHVRPRDHSQRLFMLCSLAIWARSLEQGVRGTD